MPQDGRSLRDLRDFTNCDGYSSSSGELGDEMGKIHYPRCVDWPLISKKHVELCGVRREHYAQ